MPGKVGEGEQWEQLGQMSGVVAVVPPAPPEQMLEEVGEERKAPASC